MNEFRGEEANNNSSSNINKQNNDSYNNIETQNILPIFRPDTSKMKENTHKMSYFLRLKLLLPQ